MADEHPNKYREPTQPEIDAIVERDLAEAENFRAEAAVHRQEELEGAERVRVQRAQAVSVEIELDRLRHVRAQELAADTFHHTYLFDKEVSEASVKACVVQLSRWVRTAEEKLTIDLVINSPGGSIFDGFALIDYIESLHAKGHTINTTAYGMAASMAGVLLQVGKSRSIGKNALLLLHEGSLGAIGDFGQVEDRVKLMELMHGRILDLFENRAKAINPKSTKAFIKKNWERRDWWLTADETVRLGFADRLAAE